MDALLPMPERLATLRASADGTVDARTFTTYAGGMITRNQQGALRIREVLHAEGDTRPTRELYQSACIRITGGFDD